jgi:pantoate--beta-alanine ligase
MGALHAGHLRLVQRARAECGAVLVSVFVNPLQFDDARDLEHYPRDLARDRALLEEARCGALLTGTLATFFPEACRPDGAVDRALIPWVEPGPAAEGLEGARRPGHFRGVATIVARLFELAGAARAYFGEKDFQQTLVVRAVAARMASGPEIVVCDTVRDGQGLALSSRNQRLGPADRRSALALSRALFAARAAWSGGARDAEELHAILERALVDPGVTVDYAELRDPLDWSRGRLRGRIERAQALVAARVGAVRLIDNLRLDAPARDVA